VHLTLAAAPRTPLGGILRRLIVIIAFAISLVAGALFEFQRLIGGRVLDSFLLGTYHRPRREQRIAASSARLSSRPVRSRGSRTPPRITGRLI
jgi:hypothetical protein